MKNRKAVQYDLKFDPDKQYKVSYDGTGYHILIGTLLFLTFIYGYASYQLFHSPF